MTRKTPTTPLAQELHAGLRALNLLTAMTTPAADPAATLTILEARTVLGHRVDHLSQAELQDVVDRYWTILDSLDHDTSTAGRTRDRLLRAVPAATRLAHAAVDLVAVLELLNPGWPDAKNRRARSSIMR